MGLVQRRWLAGTALAALWLICAVVTDVLLPPTVILGSLFAVAPLIACAVLPPAGTAVFAVAAVGLAIGSASWDQTWGSTQQWVRVTDVVLVSGVAVLVAASRVRREKQYADVAEQAAAATRDALRASGRQSAALETMLTAVASGSAVRDRAGRITDIQIDYANDRTGEFFGRCPAEIVGRRWSDLWPSAYRTELFEASVRTIETGEPLELTDYAVTADTPGGPVQVVVDLRAARLDDGLVAAWRDVGLRQRAWRAVAAASAQFSAAFEHAPVGMLLHGPGGEIVRANRAFGAMIGLRPDGLVGASPETWIGKDDAPEGQADFDRLAATEQPVYHRERRLVTADGDLRWVDVTTARIEGVEGVSAVSHVEDIHERKTFEGRLRFLADHDALTGLFNRRRFHEELAHQLALDTRYGGTSAVVLVDLDNFKYINDTLGHQAGDRLVQVIARTLRSRLRDSDVVGRLGGDEFAALLPEADEAHAVSVTGSLLAAIRGCEVMHDGQRVRSTGSAGIAVNSAAVTDADDLLANADLAMYAAKESGRNGFVVYDPAGPHAERARARFRWLDRVRHALDQNLFTLHAQPILDLNAGEVTGCELLLRMREDGRLVHPDRFLYIAERHGLANPIDRFVITHAISLASALRRPGSFRWEINLSADSLGDPGIPELIETELARTGLPAEALVFEITETAAISNFDEAQTFANRITDIGCQFALDDFGAGYGSFYYLKHLPFEYLKIDGEFIRQVTTSDVDRVIVDAIVSAAQRLGKQTIAEYVGDAATLDLLRSMRVDHAQGYYIGRPAEPEWLVDSTHAGTGHVPLPRARRSSPS